MSTLLFSAFLLLLSGACIYCGTEDAERHHQTAGRRPMTAQEMEEMLLQMRAELRQQKDVIDAQSQRIRSQEEELAQLQLLHRPKDGVSAHWQTHRATPHHLGPPKERDSQSMPQSPRTIAMRRRGPETGKGDPLVQRTMSFPAAGDVLEKRSDDFGTLANVVGETSQKLIQATADIQALQNAVTAQQQATGTTYVHWGNRSCNNDAETVYSGIISGGAWNTKGAPANYLCLTLTPTLDNYVISNADPNTLVGSEYEIGSETESQTTPMCAVCRVPRTSVLMTPGTNRCAQGWHLEYTGHLMAGFHGGSAASEFVCVDLSKDYQRGSQANDDQNLIYYVVTKCGSAPCPPYANDKVVTCVVCSK